MLLRRGIWSILLALVRLVVAKRWERCSHGYSGLRTLCLAYKVVPEDQYQEWAHRYHEATVALEEREEKIEAVSDEMERGLRLLGATAIEDKLQDGVPEAIADLKRAGIKVWVATGDKLETAICESSRPELLTPH